MNISPISPTIQGTSNRTANEKNETFRSYQPVDQSPSINPAQQGLSSSQTIDDLEQPKGTNAALEAAISKVNDNFKNLQNQSSALVFTLDSDLGRVIARLVDSETKEVIRQYPPEEMLEISRQMDKLVGKLLKENA